MRRAMELMLTGDSMSGVEVDFGFANRSFPADELEAQVLEVALRVAKIPPDLQQINKCACIARWRRWACEPASARHGNAPWRCRQKRQRRLAHQRQRLEHGADQSGRNLRRRVARRRRNHESLRRLCDDHRRPRRLVRGDDRRGQSATGRALRRGARPYGRAAGRGCRVAAGGAKGWRARPIAERQAMVAAAGERLRANAGELARLFTREQGRPVELARREIERAATWMQEVAKMAPPVHVVEDSAAQYIETCYVPSA